MKVWDKRFEDFKSYVIENGHFPFSKDIYNGTNVGIWFAEQKRLYHSGLLKMDKIKKLSSFNPYWLNKGIVSFEYMYDSINSSDEFWKRKTPAGKTTLQDCLSVDMLYECIMHNIFDCETYIEKYQAISKAYDINLYKCYAKILGIDANCLILLCKIGGLRFCSDVISWYKSLGFSSQEELENELKEYLSSLKYIECEIILLRSGFNVNRPLTLEEVGERYMLSRATTHYKEKVALQKIREIGKIKEVA